MLRRKQQTIDTWSLLSWEFFYINYCHHCPLYCHLQYHCRHHNCIIIIIIITFILKTNSLSMSKVRDGESRSLLHLAVSLILFSPVYSYLHSTSLKCDLLTKTSLITILLSFKEDHAPNYSIFLDLGIYGYSNHTFWMNT